MSLKSVVTGLPSLAWGTAVRGSRLLGRGVDLLGQRAGVPGFAPSTPEPEVTSGPPPAPEPREQAPTPPRPSPETEPPSKPGDQSGDPAGDESAGTTPAGIPAADPAHNPDTTESDFVQPGTEEPGDPATAKRVRGEAKRMGRAADPDL